MGAKRNVLRALHGVRDALDATYNLSEEIKVLLIKLNDEFTEFRSHAIQEADKAGQENRSLRERLGKLEKRVAENKDNPKPPGSD